MLYRYAILSEDGSGIRILLLSFPSKNVCHCWHYKYRWGTTRPICVVIKRN